MKPAQLLGIAYKTASRMPMIEVEKSTITISNGLDLDYKGSLSNKRQITILSKSDWDQTCHELQTNVHWTIRRANLLIDYLEFYIM